ncbi:hypothetical protein COCOBI_17-3180 [Coccomyxa sp. Obi]|nr:hypothetical protein COCOBI_17-3180 [Coccomyxa sp. Obi]
MSHIRNSVVVEEMRLLGNTLFKLSQYRRARQVYKNGLALMDLCPDTVCITGPPFRGHINSTRAAMPLSPRDNLTAATLLVNLAQALLSGSISPDAAREAFYILAWAESHLAAVNFMNMIEPTHASAQEVQRLDQQYTNLLEKAFMRKEQNKRVLMVQYYISIVFGRVFVCMLADIPVPQDLIPCIAKLHLEVAESLIRMQHELMTQPSVNVCPACQCCGKSDPPPNIVANYPSQITKKVCKRCRLVRYCGRKCQQADWHKHRTVCWSVAAGEEMDLWAAEHSD